jgi:predicted RNA binding protein YcfA (HicA-like mRNA interferase family)
MEKLPRITAVEVIKAMKRAGFFLARQSGSHKIFKNRAGKRVTIPYHSGKTIHLKILHCILMDADLSVEKFKELLK